MKRQTASSEREWKIYIEKSPSTVAAFPSGLEYRSSAIEAAAVQKI
jgi:hypothetical protein